MSKRQILGFCLVVIFSSVCLSACFGPAEPEFIDTPEETTEIIVVSENPTVQETTDTSPVQTTEESTTAETTPAPTDPPLAGKVYLYLTANVLPAEQLGQVYVVIENQSNRKFAAAAPLELQELVNGAWQTLNNFTEHSEYRVDKGQIGQEIVNLSSIDLSAPGRQFRFYQKYKLLKSNGDVEQEAEVYSQNFTIHTQARLTDNEYIRLGLDKTEFTVGDLAQFNLYVENASAKYVMVFRGFSIQVFQDEEWVDYPLTIDFGQDSWYIEPNTTDKQSYNLRAAGLDPNAEAYRVVKAYGLFYSTASSQESESFYVVSEPFKLRY
ncbi:MAG: hypothetical protein Q4P65_04170 [Eubacteriales bacterium]|nr:hypothetical protein [Eubacteriales bacterium]